MIKLSSFLLTCGFSNFLNKPIKEIKGFEDIEGMGTVEDFLDDEYYHADDLIKIVAAAFEECYKLKE